MLTTDDIGPIQSGTIALVKPDEWFYGPDGRAYTAAYGPITAIKAEQVLGFKPKNSADWFLQVGYEDKAVLLAGCRVHYAGLFAKCPPSSEIYDAR
jgi:hypothetical protein